MDLWFASAATISFWTTLMCVISVRVWRTRQKRAREHAQRLLAAARAQEAEAGLGGEETALASMDLVYVTEEDPPPADMGGQEDEDGPKTCIVCWERHPILTLRPCAHTLCAQCSLRVSKCPLCRANIVGRSVIIGTQRPRRLVFAAGGQAPAMLV